MSNIYQKDESLFLQAQAGDRDALDFLMEKHTRLVYFVLEKRFFSRFSENTFQNGLIGLWQAIMRFNPLRGQFSTFAFHYIWGIIRQGFKRNMKDKKVRFYGNGEALDHFKRRFSDREAARRELQDLIWNTKRKKITARGRGVLLARSDGYLQTDLAKVFGVTNERIRQLEEQVILEIREAYRLPQNTKQ